MNLPSLQRASVHVPCSTSNLGAGFDCIGLALDRYLDVTFEPAGGELHIERAGTLTPLHVAARDDAVVRAFSAVFEARGMPVPRGSLRMTSAIPIARGLGSSAAATVAGLLLAHATLGATEDRMALLADATRIEGHPDNAAPSLFGGLVGIAFDDGVPRAFPLTLSPRLAFAWAAPAVEVSTSHARSVLPATIDHAAAVRSLSRVAALIAGLATADPVLLEAGFTDELHVPHRLALIPGASAAMEAARAAGAFATTISGSGSGLIAVCPAGRERRVADAMADAFRGSSPDAAGVIAFPVYPSPQGAEVAP
jgi:homoserine kinase